MLRTTALFGMPALLAGTLLAAPASAREGEHYTTMEEIPDLCGSLAVRVIEDADLAWIRRPADGDAFSWTVWTRGTVTVTSLTNGKVVSMTWHKADRDVRVHDNGDGTRDVSALNTRLETWVGPDGTTLRNRGPMWLEVVVTDNGTPSDAFDDYWVEFVDFRQGGNWDMDATWCDQMVAWLG